jgi:CspA family cold shock protein
MVYRDAMVTCASCGKDFVYRVEDQRRQTAQGEELVPPEMCPSCRGESPAEYHPESREEREHTPAPAPRVEKKVEATVALGPGPHEGVVKWYDTEKGYGFVAHPNGEEIFFHRTGIAPGEKPSFPDGTPVTFLIEQSEKGPQAVDVARLDGEDEAPEEW